MSRPDSRPCQNSQFLSEEMPFNDVVFGKITHKSMQALEPCVAGIHAADDVITYK